LLNDVEPARLLARRKILHLSGAIDEEGRGEGEGEKEREREGIRISV